jgi:two-component system response regulator AtoC
MSDSLSLRRIVAPPSLMATHRATPGHGIGLEQIGDLLGACPSMRRLFATIRRIGPTAATVLVLGERGSGKELVARAIHDASPRRSGPFIAVSCEALPANLVESELFGHERGGFVGAVRAHRGCFERANGGTLFLDEIAQMPVELQVRMLRVLETGRYARVGGDLECSTDVRVIAASHSDLGAAVAAGRLREDLMYRLCVIPVVVPPLRERASDALLLAESFLADLNAQHRTAKAFSADARAKIAAHRWPGNVRELRNVVQRAFVLADGVIDVEPAASLVPVALSSAGDAVWAGDLEALRIPIGTRLDEAERVLILATLAAASGSKVKAAQALGISLKTLYNRLHAYREAAAGAERRPTVPLPLSEAA